MSSFQSSQGGGRTDSQTRLPPPNLPISHLESLKFKANQIIDSIQSLQNTLMAGNQAIMPSWPEILTKYNIILSQTHSFSMGLASHPPASSATGKGVSGPSPLERVALHPRVGMTDAQLDTEVIPLLRNQQTLDVLRAENESVRRLAEHMATKGSLGVLGAVTAQPAPTHAFGMGGGTKKVTEYEDVLGECEEIRSAHDRRVERAVRAVTMLKEKFDWKARVEVEVEEPEELEWDPRVRHVQDIEVEMADDEILGEAEGEICEDVGGENGLRGEGEEDAGMGSPDGGSSDEGDEVQAMVDAAMDVQTPAPTTSNDADGPMQNGVDDETSTTSGTAPP